MWRTFALDEILGAYLIPATVTEKVSRFKMALDRNDGLRLVTGARIGHIGTHGLCDRTLAIAALVGRMGRALAPRKGGFALKIPAQYWLVRRTGCHIEARRV